MSPQYTFSLIEKRTGNEVEAFDTLEDALAYVRDNAGPNDQWALFRFGWEATDSELLAADSALLDLAASEDVR